MKNIPISTYKHIKTVTFLFVVVLLIASCKKENGDSPILKPSISLEDTEGNQKNTFKDGEDIVFVYTEYNTTTLEFSFYRRSNSPAAEFEIYDDKDNLVTTLTRDDVMRTLELRVISAKPNQVFQSKKNLLNQFGYGKTLPAGSYKAVLSEYHVIRYIDNNLPRNEFRLEFPFIVE
jgi:hypothetical protein